MVLQARIRSGALRIAARQAVDLDNPIGPRVHQFIIIRDVVWINNPDDRFWDIGDHTLQVPLGPTGYSGFQIVAEFHGIRLDPAGFEDLRRDLGIPSPPPPAPTLLKRISNAPPPIKPLTGYVNYSPKPQARNLVEIVLAEFLAGDGQEKLPTNLSPADKSKINAWARAVNIADPYPVPSRPTVESPVPKQVKVDTVALTEWVAGYFVTHPNADFAQVRDAARTHFVNLRVTERPVKKAIADLGKRKPVGRSKT